MNTNRSLFADAEEDNLKQAQPLAARMRPTRLADYVGQQHILGEGKLLRRMIDAGRLGSVIFSGPPGTGKTTLAHLLAIETKSQLRTLSAVSSGVKDVRDVLAWAGDLIASGGPRPLLFIDEIHRFSKSQQDALLPDVEAGVVSLIGATTSNPYFAVNAALLSRSQLFQLEALSPDDIEGLIRRAITNAEYGLGDIGVKVDEDAIEYLSHASEGDARRALSALEIAVRSCGKGSVTRDIVKESLGSRLGGYDATGDDHYDLISAMIKSIRGSDADAGIYWLARMLEGGEDIRFLCRRLVILASEDIGNADPQALSIAVAAMQACEFIGLPEAQLTLSQTVAYLALAPKSNAATKAIADARTDVRENKIVPVPKHLRDAHYAGASELGNGDGYRSAHKVEGGVVALDYLGVDRRYYKPVDRGFEAELKVRMEGIRKILDEGKGCSQGDSQQD
ncbi:replication-associated recombination protein A [Rubripirellula reticaptiva]|uniref:Replication-associated recombination protein A n=1 Tax=Rubripirellula reticaptiva TaxID=2528013 RepID=A0A5C6EL18_9BACT|nr:replication-associated recombination protein A [Rubripirellula reticaptiva]TWU49154.1 Replication-associated recombination protein A [Rubripirellula reticaptiva]